MKLRNKKTGEIGSFIIEGDVIRESVLYGKKYYSLAELNEEWEDYEEEPKEYWYLDCYGMVLRSLYNGNEWDERRKLIGNYFETREEAEKVVEKLKAWKRLKDKGFKFGGHDDRDRGQLGDIVIYAEMPTFEYDDDSTRDDLDLIFGDEE